MDLDGSLFKVNVAVSRAYPQNDSGKSVRDIIDRTISDRVRLRHSDTPLRSGVPGGVSCENVFHISLSVYQIRDLSILLHDLIVRILSFDHVDSLPH